MDDLGGGMQSLACCWNGYVGVIAQTVISNISQQPAKSDAETHGLAEEDNCMPERVSFY